MNKNLSSTPRGPRRTWLRKEQKPVEVPTVLEQLEEGAKELEAIAAGGPDTRRMTAVFKVEDKDTRAMHWKDVAKASEITFISVDKSYDPMELVWEAAEQMDQLIEHHNRHAYDCDPKANDLEHQELFRWDFQMRVPLAAYIKILEKYPDAITNELVSGYHMPIFAPSTGVTFTRMWGAPHGF